MSTPTERVSAPWQGALWMLAAAACFAGLGVFVKVAAPVVGAPQVAFWRGVISMLIVPLLAYQTGQTLRPVNLRMHGFRGVFGLLSMLFYFTAIERLPFLGDAVLITFLSPLLVAGIARPILGEKPVPLIWAALLLGLAGVGLVIGPSGALEPIGTIAAALSACLAACAYVSVSMLTRTDSTASVVFWFSVWCVVWTAPSLLVGGAAEIWPQLLAVGVLGTGGQWALTRAYACAPAAQVAVFAYATPVFAYGLGIVTLSEWPPLRSVAGAAIVIVAGAMAGMARPKA